jgi:N-acetylmuramoyl-L-alanine amidase
MTVKFRWRYPSFLLGQGLAAGKHHQRTGRQLPYLLFLTFYFLLLALPAQAAKLESWKFDPRENRLEFTTDEGVQPKAQLILNPTRLVIDLPGISLGRSAVNQSVGGAIRSIRVAQFDRDTTRLVVELAPNYTLDPQQVKFRGIAPNQWTVQLPTPQLVAQSPDDVVVPTEPNPSAPERPVPSNPGSAGTLVEGVQVTPDGVFVRTSGSTPRTSVRRSGDRRQITIDLQGATIASSLKQRDVLVNRLGVSRLVISQASPTVTRLTLNVERTSPNWQASVSQFGGVVLIPTDGVATSPPSSQPPSTRPDPPPSRPPAERVATISAVDLEENGNRLVVRADQAVTYTTGWDRTSAAYRIAVSPARLADNVRGPKLDASSSVLRVRLRQEDPRTVAILVQPAAGVRVGDLSQPSQGLLALQLQRTPRTPNPAPGSVVVPPPANQPTPDLPRVPNGRVVVVVDPGHGGPDPGAVGINGLQEKGIVLDIGRQVADLLERQGVTVVLTRSDDRDLDLEPRVQMAQRANATVFVSIHANAISLSRPDVNGLETYYHQSGSRLAQVIHNSILQGTDVRDRGVRQARFYVLRRTSMPAVLIEVGFVTGREDAAKLSTPAYRSQMAAAIARGILQYIQ